MRRQRSGNGNIWRVLCLLVAGVGFGATQAWAAAPIRATIPAGNWPKDVAVNPVTNKIYVANERSNNVTVIDGSNNSTTTVAAGGYPKAIAVNPVTNKIYVVNYNSNSVTVINGTDNSTTTVAAGNDPEAITVNPVTNKIYVANYSSNNVTVIDGTTDTVTDTVAAGSAPSAIAVNPLSNRIYVANVGSNNVTVIDGSNHSVITAVAAGAGPSGIAINPVTNRIYVANCVSNNVTVINGNDNSIAATVPAGTYPVKIAVNPATNKIYVKNMSSNNITVINGADNTRATVAVETSPLGIAVNATNNKIYVANAGSDSVSVINGADNSVIHVPTGGNPNAVAVNPLTGKVYTSNRNTNNVTMIDGDDNTTASVATGTAPEAAAVNPVTNKIYIANCNSDNVTVIDGSNNSTVTVAAGTSPYDITANPVTNKIYVANYDSNNVTVINGANNSTETVAAGTTPYALAANPVTNKVYVANWNSNNVTVIDDNDNNIATVEVGSNPEAIALNPVTNRIYVANGGSNNVTVIDGVDNTTTTVAAGSAPVAIALNPVTNRIYVANYSSNTVTVINGNDNTTSTVATGTRPCHIAVNSVTNKIYVVNQGASTVTVINGIDNTTATVVTGLNPLSVTVNEKDNKIYVGNYNSNNVTVIDGASNATVAIPTGQLPLSLAINPVTNKVYVVNQHTSNVTVLTPQAQANPLTTAISGLPNNKATAHNQAFTFSASTTYAPNTPAIRQIYYQLDSCVGTWAKATSGGAGSATIPTITPGWHTLYTFAVDEMDGTSLSKSSSLCGEITAYSFFAVAQREVDVYGNGNSIATGDTTPDTADHTDFGMVNYISGTMQRTFTIANYGIVNLSLNGTPKVEISGAHASEFIVTVDPVSPVASYKTTTFTVSFDPAALGVRSATLTILNDDIIETPYTFAIQGIGALTEMDVQGNGNSITSGDTTPSAADHTDFGSVNAAAGTIERTFTIANTGNAPLTLSGVPKVEVSGTHAADFTITADPASPVASGATTTFTVSFDPSGAGVRSATLSIANDDNDENPYMFAIQGTGLSQEIDIQGNGGSIAVGTQADFGSVNVASGTIERTFTIVNTGTLDLTLNGAPKVAVSGSHAANFTVLTDPESPLTPGTSTTFTVSFNPGDAALHTATLTIDNNDLDENPYTFTIQGTGILPAPPVAASVTFSSPVQTGAFTTDANMVSISGNAFDEAGITSIRYLLTPDDATAPMQTGLFTLEASASSYAWSFENIAIPQGSSQLTVYAFNSDGNISGDSITIVRTGHETGDTGTTTDNNTGDTGTTGTTGDAGNTSPEDPGTPSTPGDSGGTIIPPEAPTDLGVPQTPVQPGSPVPLMANMENLGQVDVYVVLIDPQGNYRCVLDDGNWSEANTPAPYLAAWESQHMLNQPLVTPTLPHDASSGTYTWVMIVVESGADPLEAANWLRRPSQDSVCSYLKEAALQMNATAYSPGDPHTLHATLPACGRVDVYVSLTLPDGSAHSLTAEPGFVPGNMAAPYVSGFDSVDIEDALLLEFAIPAGIPAGTYAWTMRVFAAGSDPATATPLHSATVSFHLNGSAEGEYTSTAQ